MTHRSSIRARPASAQTGRARKKRSIATGGANFPMVAIGASAGGLDAFRTLLAALPEKTGMAFMLVQHLDPAHASMMVELLAPHTALTVLEAREGMELERDHVYIIPPGRYLAVRNGALRLSQPQARQGVRMPFDFLLQSLAEAFGERAVCIVLSGTANDGSVGARAIKGVGGLVIAQDPDEAEFDGMPRSAIATGAVDLVLPLAKIPDALAKYAGHPYLKTGENDAALPLGEGTIKIVDLLRKKTSHDFALYKEGTIGRRIERRMAMAGIEDSNRYLELLAKDPEEIQRLANDLFINVTRFFRDAKAFELLTEKMIPEVVRMQPPARPIRVWVAGCSTGEEAYSIAMLFLEAIVAAQRNMKLQIFASDIDEDAVAVARDCLYPTTIEADVTPARLTRFFTKEDQGYRVSRELRATIVFSVHDLLVDAPFSRLDFMSCRNLLLYLRPEVQQKVLSLFHFALREGGILFLGSSESVGGAGDCFEPISKKHRIYRHIGRSRPGEVDLPLGHGEAARALWNRPERPTATPHANVGDFVHRLLLESYAPASVLINRKHQGLYYFGPIDLYLKMPTGVASLDLLASAREGLRPAIRAALEKASQGLERAVAVTRRVKRNGGSVAVTVNVRAVKRGDEELVLLSFVDAPKPEQEAEAVVELPADASRIVQIEQELDITRMQLEAAIRDREIAEEEIRVINEEAMSVNEEFQTTNEELETSKEELQSLNEELTALNNQLHETLEQHQAVANDLENILNSADVATLFLDEKLNIRFFTPAAKSLFSVIASDIGRPLADLARHFAGDNLLVEARAVLSNLVSVTREISGENGAWYACRILPYRTKENHIEGVVITFVDVTARKQAEEALNAAKLQAESANLGKSRFLAAASHDLRQPLQTLTLLQGLLATKIKDKGALDLVARGDEALTAMSSILNTLLDVNQLEAGVIRPAIIDFPINDILERLRTEYGFHAAARTRKLDWRVLPCPMAIRSDPRLLEQMIRNLLSNALKYTKKGGILLGCRRRADKLRIEIWDTGLGIPAGRLGEIFREFHQIDNPARELNRGLGLGLAIVQRLGELLGHAVDVRSRLGSGSVFAVEVPLAPEGTPIKPAGIGLEQEEINSGNGSILIVEDDPTVRDSLEILLNTEGYRTMVAADGEEAIVIVARASVQPDMVIVDYNLPRGLTGVQIMTRLREVLGHDLPALILTGDISTETLSEIARQGYVHRGKPAKAEDLTRVIRQLLAEPRPALQTNARRQAEALGAQPETLFVVDDDSTVREALRALLQAEGKRVEIYASGEAFFDAYHPGIDGCVLVDAGMPGMIGLELLRWLKAEGQRIPVIMITGNGDVRMAVQAMRAGAADFIEKPIGREERLASIERALEQAADSAKLFAWRETAAKQVADLTPRQCQIMELVLAGHPSKNIAVDLGISQRTVENHRALIMKKTGSKSLPALVRLALAAVGDEPLARGRSSSRRRGK
jgi:two-component system CheB/CheR fusion protein